jgi:predicted RNA binding protein YcfA (HicA-like mRNA interferase family)
MKFTELVRVLEQNGFRLIKEKGSIRYYAKSGHDKLIRVDFHGAKEIRQEPVMLFLRPQESGKGVSR